MKSIVVALGGGLLALSTLAGAAAYDWQAARDFFYSPVPRWAFNPERDLDFSEQVCPAIRKECPSLHADEFAMSFAYDELYDATGKLAGVRLLKGSGCAPLDESIVLGQREFRAKFHKEGESDLDDITVEVVDSASPDVVRIVKRTDNLQFNGGCP